MTPAPGGEGSVDAASPSAWRLAAGTVFGVGRAPFAPGTCGSLVAVLAVAAVFGVEGLWDGLDPQGTPFRHWMLGFGAALGGLLVLGCWVGRAARSDYGVEDPGAFVLDEVVGQGLALWPVVMQSLHQARTPPWWWLALAFAAFRVFDIAKPPPVRQAERLHGGVGIMADDVVAGLFALVVVWLAIAP